MIVIAVLVAGAALVAAVARAGNGGGEGDMQGQAGGGVASMPPMPVDVDTARSQEIVDAVRATGRIEAVQAVELRPEEEGRLRELLFREGQFVARGTPLI
ncbi:MAG: hypothetical protein ACREON_08530, partial [Gemmatimonadaceae bacterium]